MERVAAAWPLLVAEVLMFGTAAFFLLIAPTANFLEEGLGRAFESVWRVLALVTLVCSPLALLINTADMAGVSFGAALPLLPQVLWGTHFGHVWTWSFAATVALLMVARLPIPTATRARGLCVFAALLLLFGSLMSHAIDTGALAVGVHFIHQIAAALWLGAIAGLWLGGAGTGYGAVWVQHAAPRVSRLAGWTVLVLVLTGLGSSYSALGAHPDRLVDTEYGRTLLVKVGAAALVLLIGASNRYHMLSTLAKDTARSALLRNVRIESLLLILILGLAALLANTPPAPERPLRAAATTAARGNAH